MMKGKEIVESKLLISKARALRLTRRSGTLRRAGTTLDNSFNEGVTYDKNGNIKTLKRYDHISSAGSSELIDDLTLKYTGNQLTTLSDAVYTSYLLTGFVMPTNSLNGKTPVEYNKNGAMKQNYYNGIAAISYNLLNLPEKIRFMQGHAIQYSYDAAGGKRRVTYQTVKSNLNIPVGTTNYMPGSTDIQSTLTTDYCAGGHIVYENGVLRRILNPEGYVTKQSNGTFLYYYYAKDHLGNNRSVFRASTTTLDAIEQEINYYPFGMPYYVMYSIDGLNSGFQPYKFGGKEYDEMYGLNWYDQGARPFGAVIPITPTQDRLAEKRPWESPYVQWANNPVRFTDPDGRDIRLYNIVKYDNNGNANMGFEGKLSPKTESAMVDLMKTPEVRAYFAQFAKKNDVVGGYRFTEDGEFSDKTLDFYDFSFSHETGNVNASPGWGEHIMSKDKSGVKITVVSYGVDKYSVGETITHETQLHGYYDANDFKGKPITTEKQDHTARKNKDTKHQGYKQYKSVQEQLENTDEQYKAAFEEAQRIANRNY